MEKKEESVRSGLVVVGMPESKPHTLIQRYITNSYLPNEIPMHGLNHYIKEIEDDTLDIYFSKPLGLSFAREHFKFANTAMVVLTCTESLADCQKFLQDQTQSALTENYAFIVIIAQSEYIGTPLCRLGNDDAKTLFNSSEHIEALYWCSAATGEHIDVAFSHALLNKKLIELPFFNQAFEKSKTHLQQYKGFKLNPQQIGPVRFFHSRCNTTKHLFEIIDQYQRVEITKKSAKQLARIVFDHYAVIHNIRSDLSLCLERILVELFGHIRNHDLDEVYQLHLSRRHSRFMPTKSDDSVYSWLAHLCEIYELPATNSVAIEILEYVQSLETTMQYKWATAAKQLNIEHLIKFSCHFIDKLYKDQFKGLDNNLAHLRSVYEMWAAKFPHIDTSKIANILKIAHIRLINADDDPDDEMLVYNY